ncbi:hypothetical protein SAY87_003366 [Trapa incisa]|uniref:Uncharacterized protein n=2 Tax=Trapa TaxID=22665 RepID=A0AAN7L3X1_TRANT|nr:hypothetical protein SAY87_003366 [Trapa incisa]KAK4779112.1 hypothetical protein SAY86_006640 [Trapa natans]
MEANLVNHFSPATSDEFKEVKKGPWTAEEDALLMNYVSLYGEGRWNSLALFAGLKRTGKSCRLRWLNYLRPDLRRGNMTLQEQLLILELHSRWGNRWSKIAQYLPGRTDNEIKNYWRTRVQKQAKQLKCDVDSKQFRDVMQHVWIPRLRERVQSSSITTASSSQATGTAAIYDDEPAVHDQVAHQTAHSGSTSPSSHEGSYSDNNTQSSLTDSSLVEGSNCCWLGGEQEDLFMMDNLQWYHENIEFLQQQLFDD